MGTSVEHGVVQTTLPKSSTCAPSGRELSVTVTVDGSAGGAGVGSGFGSSFGSAFGSRLGLGVS